MVNWKPVYTDSTKNTAVASSSFEIIASSRHQRDKHQNFNSLEVSNRDKVDIEIRLEGPTAQAGRVFVIPANTIFRFSPEDGIYFSFFTQHNLSTDSAQIADKIIFRWAKSVRVD